MCAATRRRAEFYTKQFADALAPSNFVLTNPEVLRTTMRTNGGNLVRGLDNLLADKTREISMQKKLFDLVKKWRQDVFVEERL